MGEDADEDWSKKKERLTSLRVVVKVEAEGDKRKEVRLNTVFAANLGFNSKFATLVAG